MTLDIETVWKILGVVFACGMVWAELKAIRRDISRVDRKVEKLDEKVQKHNNFDRRLVRLETLKQIDNTEETNY